MSVKKQLASSGAWTVAGSVLNNLSSFVVFAVLTRVLTPTEFGVVAFATIFIEVGRTLVVAGISDALVQRKDWEQAVANTGFWLNLGMGVVVALLLGLAAISVSSADYGGTFGLVLAVLSLDLVIEGLTSVHVAKLRREFRYKELATRGMMTRLLSAVVGIVMALSGAGVWALVVSRLVGSLGWAAITWRISGFRPGFSFSGAHVRSLGPFAMNQLGTQLLSQANSQAGGLVIGALLGPAAIAQYRVGGRALGIIVALVITPVQQAALSAFSRLQERTGNVGSGYLRMTRACSLIACPILFGLAAVAPDLVAVLFGPNWVVAGYVLMAMSLFVGPATINYFQNAALAGAGRSGLGLWATLASSASNLTVAVVAAPFGPIWVAAAQTLRPHVLLPLNLRIMQKGIGVAPMEVIRNVAPAYLCGALMFGVVLALRLILNGNLPLIPRITLCVLTGAVVYGLSLRFLAPQYLRDNIEELAPLLPAMIRKRIPGLAMPS